MEFRTVEEVLPGEEWMTSDVEDEEENNDEISDHQYDDYEDLFSNETMSQVEEDLDGTKVGIYLNTDPALQKEVGQLIMLQRYLDSLKEKRSKKEIAVVAWREKIKASRTRLAALQDELNLSLSELSSTKDNQNVASYQRLQEKKLRIETEIEDEEKVEQEMIGSLTEAELDFNQVDLEQKHFTDLAQQITEKEEIIKKHKEKMAKYRYHTHEKTVKLNRKKFKDAERALKGQLEERKALHEQITQSAFANHEKAKQHLKESLNRIHKEEEKNDVIANARIDRKVQNIVGLKNSIIQSRENMKALQARDAARAKKKMQAEKAEYEQIVNEGGNPEFFMMRQKKIMEKQQAKTSLAAKQKLNQAKIVEKILHEEDNLNMRKKQQPWLFGKKVAGESTKMKFASKPTMYEKLKVTDDYKPVYLVPTQKVTVAEEKSEIYKTLSDSDSSDDLHAPPTFSSDSVQSKPRHSSKQDGEEILTQPEFDGLWDKKEIPYKPAENNLSINSTKRTKMEQEILEKTLERHRKNIVKKQIAGGREFKGQPFYSKPDKIHFKDLEVGKVYNKKITITNVSYTMNFLRLEGISEHLKDFIKIDFDAPGQMSAGMSCEMFVTFKPMINQDLVGKVFFLAQTGPFSIPLICSTKKCDLLVDVESINFGTQVVGETIRRSVTLTNKGALSTRFEFIKIPDKPTTNYSVGTSLGRLTTADTSRYFANESADMTKTAATTTRDMTKKSKRVPAIKNNVRELFSAKDKTALEDESWLHTSSARIYDDTTRQTTRGDSEAAPDQIEETSLEEYFPTNHEDALDFQTNVTEYNEAMPDELKVGEIMSGEIEAFSSVRLDIVFSPSIPGDIQANFLISFADQDSKPIEIKVAALAVDVPVWLERQTVDLKICMFDRLYQEQIHVHNRSSTALRLHFEVPKELQDHMELLPKTGFIQAKSKFVAQLKFLPRLSLAEDAGGLFDPESGILEAPLVVRVADQTRPVPFVVNAVVTTSDFVFDQTSIDFGHCSVYESVVHTIKLTNRSILPQLYGFVDVPDFVDIQPNDGFGKILPLETLELDIILSVKQAKQYNFSLTCKSGINRDFRISCKSVGVLPPLQLSHQVVNFASTPLDNVSTSLIYVVNSHTSANEFTHPVPRIGKGDIVPVGPTSFEFIVPKDAPISIHPMVGTVNPGEKCHITFEFCPKLDEDKVLLEACRVAEQIRKKREEEEERLRKEAEEAEVNQQEEEKSKRKKTPKTPGKKSTPETPQKSSRMSDKVIEKKTDVHQPMSVDMVEKNSEEYRTAYSNLTRNFAGSFQSFTIPCFVASGACTPTSTPLKCSESNTLYVEVHCPSIKPPVVVISNFGHRELNFGPISIGQNAVKPFSIQNITDQPIELTASSLDTSGPFLMLNALRTLFADETHTVLVSFTPTVGKKFQETLSVRGPTTSLDIQLSGQGVTPDLRTDLENNKLDFGHVFQGEAATATFNIENKSLLTLKYTIHMDSQSLLRHEDMQQLPEAVTRKNEPRRTLVGTQNKNGFCVFDCVPCAGELKTNKKQEIQVTFKPDHASWHYSDAARFILFNSEKSHSIHLTGVAHAQTMYVEGNDALDVDNESLALDAIDADEQVDGGVSTTMTKKTIYLAFRSRITSSGYEPAVRNLTIGCVKSSAAAKKASEWTVEQANVTTAKGFAIDPLKSTVDAESPKQLTFTWTPPENHNPSVPVNASVTMTLKSDVTTVYNILLSGLIAFQ